MSNIKPIECLIKQNNSLHETYFLFSEKLKTSKRAIQEDNDDEDFLKQDFNKFNFSEFPIKFAEASP